MAPIESQGQKGSVDVVYLKNGEVFRGEIKEYPDPSRVCLKTLCLNTRLFPTADIDRIERDKINLLHQLPGLESSERGYFNRTGLGVLIGSGNQQNNLVLSLQMVNGYKIRGKYYPGIGTGIEFYDHAVLPAWGDFTYVMGRQRVNPFLRAGAGYSLALEDPPDQWGTSTDHRGGVLCLAGVGTLVRTGISSSLVISVVYRFQSLKSVYTEAWNEDVLNLERQYNRLSLRVGFMFD
jgi:hypothetical protein